MQAFLRKLFLAVTFVAFCILFTALSFTNVRAQWFDGFMMRGSQSIGMSMGGYFDGHRYNYFTPAGDTTVTGKAIVDTVMFGMAYYQLDTNNDGNPDFYLDCGPRWYQPDSSTHRPLNGETVTIRGKVFPLQNLPDIILVTEMNGRQWKNFTQGYHYSGNWIRRTYNGSQTVFCPTDSVSFVRFDANFMTSMMGMMWPDSFYGDFDELPNAFMPGANNDSLLFLYHFNFLDNLGMNMMYGNYGWGRGMMNYNNMVNFMFHYDNSVLDSLHLSYQNLMLKYWSDQDSSWHMMSGFTKNPNNNTISFAANSTQSYYGIFKPAAVTAVSDQNNSSIPSNFSLEQNYPNPFNLGTVIKFTLPVQDRVTLKIYNITGQEVKTILDRNFQPGAYQANWDGTNNQNMVVSSGIYFYQLKTERFSAMKKMLLLK